MPAWSWSPTTAERKQKPFTGFILLRQVLDHAAEPGGGMPLSEVDNLEQVEVIMDAAEATNAPILLLAHPQRRAQALALKNGPTGRGEMQATHRQSANIISC